MGLHVASDGVFLACCFRSAKAFIALHLAMHEKKVYALARFVRAAGAAPRYLRTYYCVRHGRGRGHALLLSGYYYHLPGHTLEKSNPNIKFLRRTGWLMKAVGKLWEPWVSARTASLLLFILRTYTYTTEWAHVHKRG